MGDPFQHGSDAKLQHLRRAGIWQAVELEDKGAEDYGLVPETEKSACFLTNVLQ